MGKGGGGKSSEEIQAEMQTNRENQASMERQAQASLEAAKIQAQAYASAAQAQANAAITSSQNAAMGGIIGAALGAHTTHEEIKQWLPHEVGAATIQSWEMAQMWNKTLQMKQAGYQDVAINYELSGKKGLSLFSDAQWNALEMARLTKQDMITNARIFGIQSGSNPGGIPLSREDWIGLNSLKDPNELLQVDPQVSAKRQAAFAKWEQQMRASGKGLLVDIYKNPQLGGSSILTMKGKDPLLDPSLAPLLGQITGGGAGGGGETVNWNQAIGALTKGEQNPMSGQINWAMQNGLVDKYGMINAGVLMSMIPPELQEAPEFNPRKNLSQQELVRLADQYDQYSQMNIDPKLISERNMGFGVTARQKLNADGTVASNALEGFMYDMMGNPIWVSMQGQRLQEFYDRMSMFDGMGPTFPGMRAPVTAQQLSGQLAPGQIGGPANAWANMSGGTKGQPGDAAPSMPKLAGTNPYGQPNNVPPTAPGVAPTQVQGGSTEGEQKPTAGTLGKTLSKQSSYNAGGPEGYTGAPLAAGGE